MQTVQLGNVTVSRLILGGNPFSGFSHQNPDRDREMLRYYTTDQIDLCASLHRKGFGRIRLTSASRTNSGWWAMR